MERHALEAELYAAFPPRVLHGTLTPHECAECDSLRAALENRPWDEVNPELVNANDSALPLLSQEAYVAYLPAWLLRGLRDPAGPVAAMLLVNLRDEPNTSGFTPTQRAVIVQVIRFITATNGWPSDDPVNVASVAAIEREWLHGA